MRFDSNTGRFVEDAASTASEPLQPLAEAWDSLPDLVEGPGVLVPFDWTPGWNAERAGAPLLMLTSIRDMKSVVRNMPLAIVFCFEGGFEGEKFVFDKDNELTRPLILHPELVANISKWVSLLDRNDISKADEVMFKSGMGRKPFLNLVKSLVKKPA